MQTWQYFVLNLILAIQCIIILTRDLQLLQQNSYYVKRYFKNINFKLSFDYILRLFDVVIKMILIFAVNSFWICLEYYVLLVFITFVVQKRYQKKSIKKIVFTNRVIRQYSSAVIIFSLIILSGYFLDDFKWFTAFFSLTTLLSVFIVSLIKIVNEPIEAAFRKHYIRDAKKKLTSLKHTKVIGITGSFGKTSTKHVLERILSEKFNVYMTPGGINTPMGIVKVVRESLPTSTDYFICEMGAKNVGDIKEICDIVDPDIAIITTVGPMHLDTFKSIDNIKKTKLELADAAIQRNGVVYFNGDNEYLFPEKKKYSANTFGLESTNEFWAENIVYSKEGTSFDFCRRGSESIKLKTRLLGKNNLLNIVLAVGVALDLGVEEADIKYAVSQLKPVEHRLELKPYINGSVLIDDAYNANPVGSKEAINVLSSFDMENKICVTPGLIELGDREYEENRLLGVHMADKCTKIILVGEKRSIPLAEGIRSVNENADITVVRSFYEALDVLRPVCNKDTVVIFENDLPDNYLK